MNSAILKHFTNFVPTNNFTIFHRQSSWSNKRLDLSLVPQLIRILSHSSRHHYLIIGKELKKQKTGALSWSQNKDAQIHNSLFKVHKKKTGICFAWEEFSLISSDTISSSGLALDRFLMGLLLFLLYITILTG